MPEQEVKWQILLTFVYPHEAALAQSYLESEGIEAEIRDELTAQVNNFYSNAIGGVKLLVKEEDMASGTELLKKGGFILDPGSLKNQVEFVMVEKGFNKEICPFCQSDNISLKSVPSIWTVVVLFLLNIALPIFKRSITCYDCGKEWKYLKKS